MSKPTERFTVVMVILSVFEFAGCDDPEPRVRYTHEYAFKAAFFVEAGIQEPQWLIYQGINPARSAESLKTIGRYGDDCIDLEAGTKVLSLKVDNTYALAHYVKVQSGPHAGMRGWVHNDCLIRPSD